MKRIISYLLAAVMAFALMGGGTATASAEDFAVLTIEASDVDLQLSLLNTQLSKLVQKDSDKTWYYTVTDLDHDGNLEFIAASLHPQDRSTNLKVWEIGADRKSLTECKLSKDEDESFPDIMTDVADTFYDAENGAWFYLFYDNVVISDREVYTIKTAVKLEDGVISYDAYAVQHTVLETGWTNVSFTDENGLPISSEQYNASGHNAFAGLERTSTNFQWLTEKELEKSSRLTDSYAVFAGAKEPTEVFPVPRPAAFGGETPVPPSASPVPATTPTPAPEVKYLLITKNPTNENNRKIGGDATFVACANAYESLYWTFVSPYGGEFSVQNFLYSFPGASVYGEYSTTLSVSNVMADMNGWGAYCTFYYRGQTARTTTAYMYVKSEPAPVPETGSLDGYVESFDGSTVTINVPGTDLFTFPYAQCVITGELRIGSPATVFYNGRGARGVNATSCTITGSTPQSGVENGTVFETRFSYVTILLPDGRSTNVDWSVCSVDGDLYEGAPATIYWEGDISHVTFCSITGRQPAPQPTYGSMSGTAYHDTASTIYVVLQDGVGYHFDASLVSILGGSDIEGASCTVYYVEPFSEINVYEIDIYGRETVIDPEPSEPEPYVEPTPYYGSIHGTAFLENDNKVFLYLDNGDTVYISREICNEIGELVMAGAGNSCTVYYTDYPNADNIYAVDVFPAGESGL